jgi:WD40 repeat protein
MTTRIQRESIPVLAINEPYLFSGANKVVKFQVEWTSKSVGIICDLDMNVYCYDERARFIEKLDVSSKRSKDLSCVLVSDTDGANTQANTFSESIKLDFRLMNKETCAVMLFLDGGPRNFQFVQSITLTCDPVMSRSSVIPGQAVPPALFQFTEKSRKDFQGVALAVIYKDGWMAIPDTLPDSEAKPSAEMATQDSKASAGSVGVVADTKINGAYAEAKESKPKLESLDAKVTAAVAIKPDTTSSSTDMLGHGLVLPVSEPTVQFVAKPIFEPVFVSSQKAKTEKVLRLVVSHVPALEKFRPRLFDTVNEVCQALSSESLPTLKEKFTAIAAGLPLSIFTEVIFRQLFKTHPKITNADESAYTVAMIQEMFAQIDYNGDGSADWDEFTTFCIQTASDTKNAGGSTIDEYVIEYQEESMMRDKVLSPYRPVSLMKFVPDTSRFLVIPDEADKIIMMNESFKVKSQLSPSSIIVKNAMGITVSEEEPETGPKLSGGSAGDRKIVVYDVIFLSGKDLYAFCSSDHSITLCREHGGVGNRPGSHVLYTRLYHEKLHTKLCWSAAKGILCSVADRVIYGWDIDKSMPIFQVSRHSDIVTDFISCDNLDIFVTCSMDKRIVMWSAHTRRVKGIFTGHKRGVRCINAFDCTLISAGFESEARTWDLYTKENIAILKGHRFSIVDAKLMCELAQNEREHRAITVDESGELRLWNIYVKEKASEAITLPAIQVFQMHNPITPTSNIRFLAIPNNATMSTSYYSDVVAVGTKLMRFLPEKNTKEFVPPSCAEFNESSAELCTLVGKSLFKYDVCKGTFTSVINNVHSADLTACALDGPRGRRMFVGCGNGDLLLLNYMTGSTISCVSAHKKDVNCIVSIQGARNSVYSCSADGSIVTCEEHQGDLHVHTTIENAFGEGVGVGNVCVAPSINVLVAASTGSQWGIWNASSSKKIAMFNEERHGGAVCAVAILGASRDEADLKWLESRFSRMSKAALLKREKEKILTVAVCTPLGVHIYSLDVTDVRGVHSFTLTQERAMYITEFAMLRYPDIDSVNYAGSGKTSSNESSDMGKQIGAGDLCFIAATDEGNTIVWNIEKVRNESENKFRLRYPKAARSKKQKLRAATPGTPGSMHATDLEEDELPPIASLNASSHDDGQESVATAGISVVISEYHSEQFFVIDAYDKNIHDRYIGDGMLPKHMYPDFDKHPKILENVRTAVQFPAHLDSTCVLVPMHEHGCFVTASHDGYHRVWNLDKACLGELALPNITEKMKVPKEPIVGTLGTTPETDMKHWSRPKIPEGGDAKAGAAAPAPVFLNPWKFIQERIAITATHEALARRLSDLCLNKNQDKNKLRGTRRSLDPAWAFTKINAHEPDTEHVEKVRMPAADSASAELRNYALSAMNEEIGPRDDGPPISIPTKSEIKLLELTDKLSSAVIRRDKRDIYGYDADTGRLGSPGSPDVNDADVFFGTGNMLPTFMTASDDISEAHSVDSVSLDPSQLSAKDMNNKKTLSNFGGKNALWNLATSEESLKKGSGSLRIAKAFSEESLVQSMMEGTIDEESFAILRSMPHSNVHQYMNSTKGTILLRNPTLSTSIELPSIDSMRRAEILFGPQKDYYRNADLVLNEKDNLNKDKMRNAITLGRIEHNVKKIGSMVHLLDPLHVDDVKIPLESKAKEYKEKMLQEDRKMQVRLLQSSTRVPDLENSIKDADVGSINFHTLNKFRGAALKKTALAEASKKAAQNNLMDRNGPWDEDPKPPALDAKHLNNISFLSQLGNVRRPLDKNSVGSILGRVAYAVDPVHHNEADQRYSYSSSGMGTTNVKQNMPQAAKQALIKKLRNAIKDEYNEKMRQQQVRERQIERMAAEKEVIDAIIESGGDPNTISRQATPARDSPVKVVLDTRALLPFYKAEDVRHFMDIFVKVDEDFSGDLDMEEWVRLFAGMNQSVQDQEARSIFMKFKNEKGFLTVHELIPVVFSKATKEQMKLILRFCLAEIMKPESEIVVLTFHEVDQLFEIYDVDNVGFVSVGFFKEKIREMPLHESMILEFLSTIAEIDDDEMVNHREFARMFKHLVSKSEMLAQRDEELRQHHNEHSKRKR